MLRELSSSGRAVRETAEIPESIKKKEKKKKSLFLKLLQAFISQSKSEKTFSLAIA